ncbi:unnamed protein product [Schistosoma mattheei]|uniref:Uncharacterized protein n=1 Tax=Schistosoma mattheei TaxID=31246 RepID=A0A3P8K996_9TREM|nr:unnamed protein product [Schistosoma mattheei]
MNTVCLGPVKNFRNKLFQFRKQTFWFNTRSIQL